AIVKRVIFLYFGSYGITLDRLHLTEILGLLNKTGKIQISNNIFAVADSKILRYADFSNININKIDNFVSKILNVFEFQANTVDFYCDYDKIIDNVLIRSRQTGDEISPVGRHCTKSLKKLFNEYKIPQETRNSIGIVADDEGVIGVVGYCVDERVKVDSSTKRIFTIRIPSED
ncbi:MAG: tRNA lysidine(34) synthetase TilS, partial [Clostridiales bacterium]|nr:tRNA lysidine(34) synthetase TilS [Clostridiales bacterium]